MSKASILIVEDEQIIALDIQNSLEDSGYKVVGRADRGDDAITKADELYPDLVLMDINLKGEMDGIKAAESIRTRFNLPVIFLTAFSDQATLDRARISEPFGYVLKPFNERELISNIEMALYKHNAEKKLRESENKFRSVIEHASDGIMLVDSQGNIIEWNPSMEQLTELKPSDVIGQQASDVVFGLLPKEKRTTDLRETALKQWNAAVNGSHANGGQMTENEIETSQGIRRNIQGNEFAIETTQGSMGGIIMRDITKNKLAEQALNESERFAHAILNALSAQIAILDENGSILAVNLAWREFAENNTMVRVKSKTHVGLNYLSICSDASGPGSEEAAEMEKGIRSVISGQQKDFSIEYPCHAPDEKRWFVAHVTRFPGEGPVRIAVAHENITERKLAEEALIVSEAQLRTHQIELEMQNEQLLQTQTELEDARARYLDLYELAPVGYLMLRENGTILEANLTAENMIGAERGKLAEQLLGKFILPEDQDIFYLCRIKLFETGAPKGCEFRMLKNDDGTQFWVRLQMTIAKGADNTPICRVVLSDITKRKQVELEILAAQNQLEATLNAIPDLLFELGLDGCYYNYHSPRSDLLAAPPEIFMGKTIFEILPANAAQIVMAGLQETNEKGHSTGKQFELQLPQGKFWFELSISRKATEPGQEVRFIVLSRDITERKQADVELRKLSQAVEQSANSIMVTDIEGNIEYTNPKFTAISGYSLTEVMGKNPRILSSGEHSHELYQNLWQTIKSGKIWHEQLHNKRKDGTLYWDDTTIAPVYDSTGKMVSFIAIKEDITARKLLEEAERDHRQLAEALRDTAMALNSTLELDEILDRILANIGMLVKYDTAMVLLIEENTVRKMRYHINPQNTINLLPIGDVQASLLNVPILKKIIQTKQSYLIPDIQKDARWQTVTIPDMQQIRSLVCVPIESHGNVVGVINIISATPDFFTPLHTERVMAFASQAAIAFENARLFEHAQQLSLTDPLTDLYNMRYFANVAKTEFERNQRYERTLSVAMMDIDHFKTINDTYGHVMGDFALTEIAARIKKAVRTVDTVARYGGDEFIVLMPETDMEEACQVAERIRQIVADGPIENEDAVISVTLSLGIAEMNKNIKSLDELIKLADQALYEAKANERNRVVSSSNRKHFHNRIVEPRPIII